MAKDVLERKDQIKKLQSVGIENRVLTLKYKIELNYQK